MNSTHVAAAGGGAIAYEKLTGLLTGWHGLSPEKADDAAWLIMAVLIGLYMLLAWFVARKDPKAPPLPPLPLAEKEEEKARPTAATSTLVLPPT